MSESKDSPMPGMGMRTTMAEAFFTRPPGRPGLVSGLLNVETPRFRGVSLIRLRVFRLAGRSRIT
jgi:hypothetical protein